MSWLYSIHRISTVNWFKKIVVRIKIHPSFFYQSTTEITLLSTIKIVSRLIELTSKKSSRENKVDLNMFQVF